VLTERVVPACAGGLVRPPGLALCGKQAYASFSLLFSAEDGATRQAPLGVTSKWTELCLQGPRTWGWP
jgi:hypothetical protein